MSLAGTPRSGASIPPSRTGLGFPQSGSVPEAYLDHRPNSQWVSVLKSFSKFLLSLGFGSEMGATPKWVALINGTKD